MSRPISIAGGDLIYQFARDTFDHGLCEMQ